MARQNLVVVTGPVYSGGSVAHRPRWSPNLATGAAAKAGEDAGYQFVIKWADDQSPDIRYLHLADEEAARRYAKLLIQELASSGFYSRVLIF